MTGDPKVDRALAALARLAAEVARTSVAREREKATANDSAA